MGKITKIGIGRTVNTGNFENFKVYFEADVDGEESYIETFRGLKGNVDLACERLDADWNPESRELVERRNSLKKEAEYLEEDIKEARKTRDEILSQAQEAREMA